MRDSATRRDGTLIASAGLVGSVLWFALIREPAWPGFFLAAFAAIAYFMTRR